MKLFSIRTLGGATSCLILTLGVAQPVVPAASPTPVWPEAGPGLLTFDGSVKQKFLAWRKSMAMAELKAAKVEIPDKFLQWVDANPSVFQTIYGFDNPQAHRLPALPKGVTQDRTDSPAQRLVCLLSLEIDLGPEITRKRNLQLALALAHAYAGKIDRRSFECAEEKLSWRPRQRLKLVIPGNPLEPVNTRASDRKLDREDHIINFLEDNPVPVDPKKPEAGTRPLFAHELMADDAQRARFVAYMKEHGHTIDPRHVTHSRRGYDMFLKAYQEKGRIPKEHDPAPTPAEKFAYLVRNDSFRFPPEVKRTWPRFNLESPWPVLEYLAMGDMPLRDREFVWNRFRETGSVRKMGHHLGVKLGLNTPVVRARRMQPMEFAYGTYAMDIKDHGACREMARIGLGAAAPLGIPAAHSFQPNHFCLSVVSYSDQSDYGLKVEQSVRGPTWITKGGVRIEDELARLFYSLNYGYEAMLDAHTGLACYRNFPAQTAVVQRLRFLESLLAINPYVPAIPREILNRLESPDMVADFWQRFTRQIEAVKRTGCPAGGHYTGFTVRRMLDGRLSVLPVPDDDQMRQRVVDICLAESSDTLWLKYLSHGKSPERVQQWGLDALHKAVAGQRDESASNLLSARLSTIGKTIKEENQRRAWGNALLAVLRGKETFYTGDGSKRREIADPSVLVAQEFAGQAPDARAALERDLRQSIEGGRSPTRTSLLAKRLAAIGKGIRDQDERRAWGETLHAIVLGNETYVTPQQPDQPQCDPVVQEIYHLGVDLNPARERFTQDFSTYLENERTLHKARAMDQRLATLVAAASRDQAANALFVKTLVAMANGHESFTEPTNDAQKRGKSHKDPVVQRLQKLAATLDVKG